MRWSSADYSRKEQLLKEFKAKYESIVTELQQLKNGYVMFGKITISADLSLQTFDTSMEEKEKHSELYKKTKQELEKRSIQLNTTKDQLNKANKDLTLLASALESARLKQAKTQEEFAEISRDHQQLQSLQRDFDEALLLINQMKATIYQVAEELVESCQMMLSKYGHVYRLADGDEDDDSEEVKLSDDGDDGEIVYDKEGDPLTLEMEVISRAVSLWSESVLLLIWNTSPSLVEQVLKVDPAKLFPYNHHPNYQSLPTQADLNRSLQTIESL